MRALLLAALLAPAPALAAPGESAAPFLLIAPGARPAALGGAFGAVADDAHAAWYNPAGLGFLEKSEVAAGRESRFAGTRYDYAVVAAPLLAFTDAPRRRNAAGVAALSLYSLAASGIERRGLVESDAPSGSFGATDRAYAASYGWAPGGQRGAAFGGTVKSVQTTLDSARASAFTADLGFLYKGERWSVGGGGRNLVGAIGYGGAKDPLPRVLFAGAAARLGRELRVSADASMPRDAGLGLAAGAEWTREFGKTLAGSLRAGADLSRRDLGALAVLSLGGGVRWGPAEVSAAWRPGGELGDAFSWSLSARF
ncbi:MAG: hypothetical protein SF051_12140 [Elusimicrobiota bacterium]|nr:hypothetical protein [Elusimicrobiota bacterium]